MMISFRRKGGNEDDDGDNNDNDGDTANTQPYKALYRCGFPHCFAPYTHLNWLYKHMCSHVHADPFICHYKGCGKKMDSEDKLLE
ncbi:unnamed protein product [Gongylonema pulchrum]|uniref:C2H2-type domain-containing protein n=1 Tax=Gongylonema pulchrum TaxID=637853 RepID=A0A183DB59_9BILA|nr:unnamed protein product [Gongylonema pulchrum]